jgi:biotin carboxyl carrier protein
MAEKYLIHSEESDVALEFERDADGVRVRKEGADTWKRAHLDRVGDSGLFLLMLDDEPTELYLERRRGGAIVTVGRHIFDYTVERWRPALAQRDRRKEAKAGAHRIQAPMTGSIVEVLCKEGDQVAAGDVVLIIESMKMNNEMRAPADGTITDLSVKAGDRVTAGKVLLVVQAKQNGE